MCIVIILYTTVPDLKAIQTDEQAWMTLEEWILHRSVNWILPPASEYLTNYYEVACQRCQRRVSPKRRMARLQLRGGYGRDTEVWGVQEQVKVKSEEKWSVDYLEETVCTHVPTWPRRDCTASTRVAARPGPLGAAGDLLLTSSTALEVTKKYYSLSLSLSLILSLSLSLSAYFAKRRSRTYRFPRSSARVACWLVMQLHDTSLAARPDQGVSAWCMCERKRVLPRA